MNDKTYDNDDNPYGKFIMHMYTNMENINDTRGKRTGFQDIEIPLALCTGKDQDWKPSGIKNYCP